ncbi:hypothetical protein HYU21_02400 [Candidatus Woesearchaeota archaeon]|nr:hypothetical protein [Candidatus Woesearchaeota archaeon]
MSFTILRINLYQQKIREQNKKEVTQMFEQFMPWLALLVSLLGLPLGFVLASLVQEEIVTGRKYIFAVKTIINLIIIIIIFNSLRGNLILAIPLLILSLILFLVNIASKNKYLELANYLYFLGAYIIMQIIPPLEFNQQYKMLLLSLIFIYGLPTGSLLWETITTTKKRRIWKKH